MDTSGCTYSSSVAAVRRTHQRHFLQPEQAFLRERARAVQQVALLQRRRRHAGTLLRTGGEGSLLGVLSARIFKKKMERRFRQHRPHRIEGRNIHKTNARVRERAFSSRRNRGGTLRILSTAWAWKQLRGTRLCGIPESTKQRLTQNSTPTKRFVQATADNPTDTTWAKETPSASISHLASLGRKGIWSTNM